MNTDPSASAQRPNLAQIAANPATDLEVLRTLAYEYPHLRPVIALNPSAYPGLLAWLGDLGDEAVNAALRQREQSGPVYPQAAGMQAPPAFAPAMTAGIPEEPEEKRRVNAGLILAIVLLLVAVPLAFVVGKLLFGTPQASEVVETTETQVQEEATGGVTVPTAEEEPSETEPEIKFPAPEGTPDIAYVAAPSQNIFCSLSGEDVRCTIVEANPGIEGGPCEAQSLTLVADGDSARRDCSQTVSGAGTQTVNYGEYAQHGDVACASQQYGMTCWNQKSGYGFALSRQGWTTGDQGFIPESEFPWMQ